MTTQADIDNAKKAAGYKAAAFVQSGMRIGLGTGSTVAYFLEALKESNTAFEAIATSEKTTAQARELGIKLLDPTQVDRLDLTVDGADEIDPNKNMIKGGGGALLREKISAAMSDEVIIIVDVKKQVDHLGRHVLPLEVTPYGIKATLRHLKEQGYQPRVRPHPSDNLNLIVDLPNLYPILNPQALDHQLKGIPGVLETGLFFNLARRVIVGYPDGKTTVIQ
jgi:ribose 5-phosphate isomerase A